MCIIMGLKKIFLGLGQEGQQKTRVTVHKQKLPDFIQTKTALRLHPSVLRLFPSQKRLFRNINNFLIFSLLSAQNQQAGSRIMALETYYFLKLPKRILFAQQIVWCWTLLGHFKICNTSKGGTLLNSKGCHFHEGSFLLNLLSQATKPDQS